MIVRFKRLTMAAALGLTLATPAFSASTAFADSSPVTRGQFIKQITDELKLAPVNKNLGLPADVGIDSPYADAVRIMLERKTMYGYSDGTFRLDQPISKDEASFVIGRFLGIADPLAGTKLKDHFGLDFGKDAGITADTASALIRKSLANDPDASDWLTNAGKSQTELKTFRAVTDMNMNIAFKPDQGIELSNMKTASHSQTEFNVDQGMHQTVTMKTPGADTKETTVTTEIYTVKDGTFVKIPSPLTNEGTVWYDMSKQMPFTFDQLLALQKSNMDLSKTFVTPYFFSRDLGTVEAGGKKLHKVEVNGKLTNAADIIKALGAMGSMNSSQSMLKDMADSMELSQMSVSISAVMTFEEQTKLPVSMAGDYSVAYGDGAAIPVDHMDMSLNMTFKDINQAIDIKLPAEAKAAKPFSLPGAPAGNN